MTHRVQQILEAVEALIADLPSLEGRIERGRVYPWQDAPAVTIRLANWRDLTEGSHAVNAEAFINLEITGAKSATETDVDAQLLLVDAEIHQILKADETLGLPFVILSRRIGFPTDANAEGEIPTGSAIAQWVFQFRHDEDSME